MSLEAFKARVLPARNKMYRFALRLMGDREDAKDVVQEVMIRVWKKRENMQEYLNMEAWCMQITKNLCYDKLKSKAHKARVVMPEQWQIEDIEKTPDKKAELTDTMNQIHNLINKLPDKQKHVIQLRDIEGYTYKEIGKILEIDINQVKVNLFRARKAIRENLVNITEYGLR